MGLRRRHVFAIPFVVMGCGQPPSERLPTVAKRRPPVVAMAAADAGPPDAEPVDAQPEMTLEELKQDCLSGRAICNPPPGGTWHTPPSSEPPPDATPPPPPIDAGAIVLRSDAAQTFIELDRGSAEGVAMGWTGALERDGALVLHGALTVYRVKEHASFARTAAPVQEPGPFTVRLNAPANVVQ